MRQLIAISTLVAACGAAPVDPAGAPRSAVVVAVEFDQFSAHLIEREAPHLAPSGFLRTALAEGASHRVEFAYANTYTAPGHIAIFSGAAPVDGGVSTNRIWDRAKQAAIARIDDPTSKVLGRDNAVAGPGALRAETVGDVLRHSTGNTARVVSLSMKDRAAILSGGRDANVAVWFDSDLAAFTTATHYGASMPTWLAAFGEAHPVGEYRRSKSLSQRVDATGDVVSPTETRRGGRRPRDAPSRDLRRPDALTARVPTRSGGSLLQVM